MAKLKLDLHPLFNKGDEIEAALEVVFNEAAQKRMPLVEIIYGIGSGQLKKRVLRFLERPCIKLRYHRLEKDQKNHGRLFIHFRHPATSAFHR